MANLYSPCYEVFLNFRGKDIRKTFLDHLYKALSDTGVNVFRDDDELPRGEDISRSLQEAIEESRISLVVFSKSYASSKWCLNELVKIHECKEKLGQIIYPIFYDVDPSEVRHQTGKIGDSLAKHEPNSSPEQLSKWRAALTAVASLSGFHLPNLFNGHEAKFIEMIIQEVLGKLNHKYMDIARHPVGINSRVSELINKLSWTVSSDVTYVGIWGMGGVGKTTLAKAIFNQISPNFDGCSFLHVGSQVSRGDSSLVALQEKLLKDILRKKIEVSCVDHGIQLIKQRLQSKRVLIVLDDVDDVGKIYSLAGEKHWFGPGSRIIITTRDEHLLKCSTGDIKYEIKCMTESESLQLFCWHAFKNPLPPEGFVELSESVVTYAQGLPLALELLGSSLHRRSMVEWRSVIDQLKQTPHRSISKQLRISYDLLPDYTTKAIFLHIACFFEGEDKEDVSKVLSSCGFFPEIGINVLIEKSLVTIDESNRLVLHNLIGEMGREIVREESKYPGERSRLWDPEDIHVVLAGHTDGLIDAVEGSTAITISNCHFTKHNDVMLFGASDTASGDSLMQITLAFNHFGHGLTQRMPRVRWGFVHAVNNDYTHWLMYAIGGSMHPTILSQGNRFIAPPNPNAKEVTKRDYAPESVWKNWVWKSQGDLMMNGAFFVESGDPKHAFLKGPDMINSKPGSFVSSLTRFSGSLKCIEGRPC